jgi:glutathione S-transferase
MAAKMPKNMHDCFQLIENDFLAGPYVLGEDYSVADPYLFTMSDWLEGAGVDIGDFPRVQDHYQRMRQRPAVVRALSEQEMAA